MLSLLKVNGEYILSPLLCGRSYIREFLDNVDLCQIIQFSDLAETTQKYMIEHIEKIYQDELLSTKFDTYDFYSTIKPKYVREYQYEYYAPRYSVVAFETGEIDEIHDWLTRESYEELQPKERKDYVFFKWTDPHGWYKTLANIITRVEIRIADYYEDVVLSDDDLREYFKDTNPVRLVVEIS